MSSLIVLPITDWIGARRAPSCPECGSSPMGRGCYHICPNSDHFYTAEQERYDDANYGCDRYDGWGDPEIYEDHVEADYDTAIASLAVPDVHPSADDSWSPHCVQDTPGASSTITSA